MEKVKVTQEQADAIDLFTFTGNTLEGFSRKRKSFSNAFKSIKELTVDEMAKALFIGYEVEPEFKVGDWVSYDNGIAGWMTKVVVQIEGSYLHLTPTGMLLKKFARHATAEEIAKEKQHRWWNSHGREVWELRRGDIIQKNETNGVTYEVTHTRDDYIGLFEIGSFNHESELIDVVYEGYRVVCFSEDRKDLEGDK